MLQISQRNSKKLVSGTIILAVTSLLLRRSLTAKKDVEPARLSTYVIPTATNRTNPEAKVLIYNKVPKCGSTIFWHTLQQLAINHSFEHVHSWIPDIPRPSSSEEAELATQLSKDKKRIAYERHLYTLDWKSHEPGLQVNLVNLVREPVERFISMFEYARAPRIWAGKWPNLATHMPNQTWFDKTLEKCVFENDPECQIGGSFPYPTPHKTYPTDMQLTYFCGTHKECNNHTSEWALQRAKQNVENLYSVVGVVEDYEVSLAVMEAYLPGWLKGASDIAFSLPPKKANKNEHELPSKKVLEALEEMLKLDIEFYTFVKQRLNLQMKSLGIQKS